jgi:hypothetical protein
MRNVALKLWGLGKAGEHFNKAIEVAGDTSLLELRLYGF